MGRFYSITHGSDSPQLAAFYRNAERSEAQANTPQLAAGKFIKISWYDDIGLIYTGWTGTGAMVHGRWLYLCVQKIISFVAGDEPVPLLYGAVSAVFIVVITQIVLNIFDIDGWIRWPVSLIFSSIPCIAGHFGYMASAPYDFFGAMLCAIAGLYICTNPDIRNFITASVILAFSLGEYQCYLAFYLSIILFYLLKNVIRTDLTLKSFFINGIYYVGSSIAGVVIYLILTKVALTVTGEKLSSYAGTSTLGITSLTGYMVRMKNAYQDFFIPDIDASYCMFPFHRSGWHVSLITILAFLVVILAVRFILERSILRSMQLIFCSLLIPMAINFSFILYDNKNMHTLHMYHVVLLFVLAIVLCSEVTSYLASFNGFKSWIANKNKLLLGLYLILFGLIYVRYDNVCYMNSEIRQAEAQSYFTNLISSIQSVEGYNPEFPVCYINDDNKVTEIDNVQAMSIYDPIVIYPYSLPIVNSYTWKTYMFYWCGYRAKTEIPSAVFADDERVKSMPSYPIDGAIQFLDGVLIVKF